MQKDKISIFYVLLTKKIKKNYLNDKYLKEDKQQKILNTNKEIKDRLRILSEKYLRSSWNKYIYSSRYYSKILS